MNSLVKKSIIVTLLVVIVDQVLKIWVKTHMYLGESSYVNWGWSFSGFQLAFTENAGMAFGLKLPGNIGKIILTIFRIVAIVGIIFLINWLIKKIKPKTGFIICLSLILGGAIGNLVDSLFYGMIFGPSGYSANTIAEFLPADGGYSSFLHGKVVDMLYFPIIDTTLPEWVPFKGGEHFVFFSPIFNFADSCVTVSVFVLILFHKRLIPQLEEYEKEQEKKKKAKQNK
ncbi:MAG: lipoprotein signal peptidase [Bacteroidales bacterium]|nr:lipoprotein signal peptidase [Bacteroidales bacterium]